VFAGKEYKSQQTQNIAAMLLQYYIAAMLRQYYNIAAMLLQYFVLDGIIKNNKL